MNSLFLLCTLSFFAYFFAHFIRAIKFWLILGDTSLSFRYVFLNFYLTSIAGFFFPLIFIEPFRVYIMNRKVKDFSRLGFAYLIHRILDGFVVSFIFFAVLLLNAGQEDKALESLPQILSIGLLCFGVFIGIFTLPSVLIPVQEYLLRKPNTALWLRLARLTGTLSTASKKVTSKLKTNYGILAILTAIVWLLDVTAVWLIGSNTWAVSAQAWMQQSASSLFYFGPWRWQPQMLSDAESVSWGMIVPQLALCIVALLSYAFYRINKSMRGGLDEPRK